MLPFYVLAKSIDNFGAPQPLIETSHLQVVFTKGGKVLEDGWFVKTSIGVAGVILSTALSAPWGSADFVTDVNAGLTGQLRRRAPGRKAAPTSEGKQLKLLQ